MVEINASKLENMKGYWEWQFSTSQDIFTSEWDEIDTIIKDDKKHSFYKAAGCLLKVVRDGLKDTFTTYVFIEEE